MQRPPLLSNEQERLAELAKYNIINSNEEEDYNFLTAMAAQICGTEMALISLITENKQWFLSAHGIKDKETPREYSFCAHAIATPDQPFIVEDARLDERFFDNPYVTGDPNVIFYTGIPLVNKNNIALGSMCVIDKQPKKLNNQQLDLLDKLSKQVVKLLELRRSNIELQAANQRIERNMLLLEETQKINDIGAWELDIKTGETYWTDMVYHIHEVEDNFEHNKQKGLTFYHPQYRAVIENVLKDCIQHNKSFDVTCLLITAKQNQKWVRVTGRKIGNKVYGGLHDITSIKQNELKFQGIFDSSFSFTGILDKDGILVEANDTSLHNAAIDKSHVIGKFFWDCYWWQNSEKHKDDLQASLKKALQGETIVYETVIWIANQTATTLLFSMKPVLDEAGEVLNIIVEGRPVQDIVDARHRYKSLLDGTNVGTWEWNIEKGTKIYNERWAGIMGFTLAEMESLEEKTWEARVHPDDWKEGEKQLKKHFEGKAAYYAMEARIKHKNGNWVWVLDQGKIMEWSPDGKPIMMYGTLLDITERKEKELEIIYQKDRLKNFAHIVSHNLRSHSAGISGILDLMQADEPKCIENEYFQWLLQGSDNLRQTVEDLTEIVKVSLETSEDIQQINLYDVIAKNKSSLALQLKEANYKVENQLPEPTIVMGVPAYWDSIILNMITNAIKYRDPEKEGHLVINATSQNDQLIIAFTDNGLGIDLEKHGDKIFGMYKTFHKHNDSRGVGLYITKNQIESMGGKIWVESTLKVGTRFKIMIPQHG